MQFDDFAIQRREPRFLVCDEDLLQCETFIEFDEPIPGVVLDISSSGLRLLGRGTFVVGQPFVTELKTDRLHGVYSGIIRLVEPWVDGKSVVGCQLLERIPDDVLATLAHEKIINRRRDERIDWKQPAKVSWELQAGEVDIEIQNCSLSGLKIFSQSAIPENGRLRIRIQTSQDHQVVMDVKTAWRVEHQTGCSVGVAFTDREAPAIIKQTIAERRATGNTSTILMRAVSIRPSIMIAATIVICALAFSHAGLWG